MTAEDAGGQRRQPTEEELRAALEEELKHVRVEQVVMEATVSILNVAVLRAGLVPGSEGDRDLEQTRVGIEAVRALLPLVEQAAGEHAKPIRDALSQLQLAYVGARGEGGQGPDAGAPGGPAAAPGGEPAPSAGEGPPRRDAPQPADPEAGQQGPAQRSGRLWVPGQ